MIEISVEVPLNVAHAWEYFFNQVNSWWPKSFFTSTKTKRFHIEDFVDGKIYEDFGEGDGLIWGHVNGGEYKKVGGPAITFEKFTFIKNSSGTSLTYSLDMIGNADSSTIHSLEEGWTEILKKHYYMYCLEKKN